MALCRPCRRAQSRWERNEGSERPGAIFSIRDCGIPPSFHCERYRHFYTARFYSFVMITFKARSLPALPKVSYAFSTSVSVK